MDGKSLRSHEPRLQSPAKYRRACRYDAFVPDPLLGTGLTLCAEAAGIAAEADAAIRNLNTAARERYVEGLTDYRADRTDHWIENFGAAALRSAHLASGYLAAVEELTRSWRAQLAASPGAPRSDAAAWAIIDSLPGHPIITAPVAAAATGRSKPQIYLGLSQLQAAGVLLPLSEGKRNQSWEAAGLFDLLSGFEAGEDPARRIPD